MPKKLTIIGALTALVLGTLAVFQGTASARHVPAHTAIQTFTGGAGNVNYITCYGPVEPTGGVLACPAGDEANTVTNGIGKTAVTASTNYDEWNIITLPKGARLTLSNSYIPSCTVGCPGGGTQFTYVPHALGDVVGQVQASVDLLCTSGADDILATPDVTGPPLVPPDVASTAGTGAFPEPGAKKGFHFHRIANAFGDLAAGDQYIDTIRPQPSSYAFVSVDKAVLTELWLFGIAGFPLPTPTPLDLATYEAPAPTGLRSGAALLGGDPGTPPTDSYVCLDSPQNSYSEATGIITPSANGLYPRWTLFTSARDVRSGKVDRVISVQCADVGPSPGSGLTDADGDCLAAVASNGQPADTNDSNPDVDGDGLPDGMEAFAGTCITDFDSDNDGSVDFDELFNFTNAGSGAANCSASATICSTVISNADHDANPTVGNYAGGPGTWHSAYTIDKDSDCDASADIQDHGGDENAPTSVSIVNDTSADDSCPADYNPTQLNTDSKPDRKLLAGYADSPSDVDTTNPHQDLLGDACDTDDDNDGIPDVTEATGPAQYRVRTSAVPLGGTDTWCVASTYVANPTHAVTAATPDKNPDIDYDLALDGSECVLGSAPDDGSATANVGKIATTGCAPDSGNDNDKLFAPRNSNPAAGDCNTAAEKQYRTMAINVASGSADDTCGGGSVNGLSDNPDCDAFGTGTTDADSDNDGLPDGIEVKFYGTSPSNMDTDGDGCNDGTEAADVDGNRTVGASDLAAIASTILPMVFNHSTLTLPNFDWRNLDVDHNGSINGADLALGAFGLIFGNCNKFSYSNYQRADFEYPIGGACTLSGSAGYYLSVSACPENLSIDFAAIAWINTRLDLRTPFCNFSVFLGLEATGSAQLGFPNGFTLNMPSLTTCTTGRIQVRIPIGP